MLRCSEPYAGATAERLRVLNSRWLARDIPYADAVSEFTECRAAVRKNRLRLAQLLTLEGDREQAKLSVSTALAAATGQITRLRGAIVELGGWVSTILEPTKSVASFSKQLEDIKAEWERHLNKVVGVAELDAPAFITRIQAVGNAAVAAVADENALLTYLEGVKRAEILAMTKEWEARIDEVAPIDRR